MIRSNKTKTVLITAFLAITSYSCNETDVSHLQELEASRGNLVLDKSSAENTPIKNADVSYSIFENGAIALNGSVTFVIPGTDYEKTIPFVKLYHTDYTNVRSAKYKYTSDPANPLRIGRLDGVVKSSAEQNLSQIKARIARTTHWTDSFYGANMVEMKIDTSSKVVKLLELKVSGAWAIYKNHDVDLDNPFDGLRLVAPTAAASTNQ